MADPIAYTELYPDGDASTERLAVAVATSHKATLEMWLCGHVNRRGFTPAWTPMLRWLVERLDMQYRDPVAPPDGRPLPDSGQLWPL